MQGVDASFGLQAWLLLQQLQQAIGLQPPCLSCCLEQRQPSSKCSCASLVQSTQTAGRSKAQRLSATWVIQQLHVLAWHNTQALAAQHAACMCLHWCNKCCRGHRCAWHTRNCQPPKSWCKGRENHNSIHCKGTTRLITHVCGYSMRSCCWRYTCNYSYSLQRLLLAI
jgi:hypothetical protein